MVKKKLLSKEKTAKLEKEIRKKWKAERRTKLRKFARGGVTGLAKEKLGLKQRIKTTKRTFSRRGQAKVIKKKERAARGILTAIGAIGGKQTYKGAGRPRGTYKHGMPIQVYKKMQRDKKALYQRYQQEQYAKLKPRGFSPEQIQQLQQQQTLQELEQPNVQQVQRQQVQPQQPIQIVRQTRQRMRVPTNMHNKLVQPGPSVADEELAFRKWSAEQTISPRTQQMLDTIRRIQNKGKADNIEQQRRIRERNMVGRSMNLMKAHENMINTDMDFTGVSDENILMAPNTFRENPENNILRNNRGAFSILNTREAGNNLFF